MGGKCFKDVVRINKEYIDLTVSKFKSTTGLSNVNLCYLGSTNKKPSSGDVDLGLEEIDNLEDKLVKNLGRANVRKIGKLITCRYPISNTNNFVQIDLLQGHIPWLKTLYHHSETTKYSGAHRNGAIRAVLRSFVSDVIYDNTDIISKKKYMWSPTNGLCYVHQYRTKNKDKYSKTWSTDILNTCKIDDIPSIIFNNKNATFNDIDSLESITEAINTYYKNECEKIFKEIMIEFNTMKFDNEFIYEECIQKYKGVI